MQENGVHFMLMSWLCYELSKFQIWNFIYFSHIFPVYVITRQPFGHCRCLPLMSDIESQYRRTRCPTYGSNLIPQIRQIYQKEVTQTHTFILPKFSNFLKPKIWQFYQLQIAISEQCNLPRTQKIHHLHHFYVGQQYCVGHVNARHQCRAWHENVPRKLILCRTLCLMSPKSFGECCFPIFIRIYMCWLMNGWMNEWNPE